jgi:hypothetical protein
MHVDIPALFESVKFNPVSMFGLSGVPTLESIVQYFREEWGLSGKLSPFMALLLSVIVNVSLGMAFGVDLFSSLIVAAVSAVATPTWHEVIERRKRPQV